MTVCNRCSLTGLHWKDVEGRWRLYDHLNRAHVCTSAPKAAEKPLTRTERILLGFSKEALALPEQKPDAPPQPINYMDAWWAFVDGQPPQHKRKSKQTFEEVVP